MNLGNPSRHALLTGAGLSRNFGGYLAQQVNNFLLVDEEINQFDTLTDLVRREYNYENALIKARSGSCSSEEVRALEGAIRKVFVRQNRVLWDYLNPYHKQFSGGHSFYCFLKKFSIFPNSDSTYLFTLNQDTLLESFHRENITLHGRPVVLPGFYPVDAPTRANLWYWRQQPVTNDLFERQIEIQDDEQIVANISLKNHANYIKLHGSADWRNQRGELLIMGGQKEELIKQSKLLSYYFAVFESVCNYPGMTLFIIGYSFSDMHINRVIEAGVNNGLSLWVWDVKSRESWTQDLRFNSNVGNCEGIIKATIYMDEAIPIVLGGNQSWVDSFHPIVDAFFK